MFSSRVSSSFGSASLSRLLLAPLHFHFFPFGADRWGRCPHFVIGLGGCTICPPTTILLLAVLSFLTFPVRPWYERFIHYGDVRKRETAIRHARYPSPPPHSIVSPPGAGVPLRSCLLPRGATSAHVPRAAPTPRVLQTVHLRG